MSSNKQLLAERKREDSILWAHRIISHPKDYIILDVETTGLGKSDRIIQIALLQSDGVPVVNALLNPEMHIPEDIAAKCHHISDDMVKGKPKFSMIAGKFVKLVRDRTIIGWNITFDIRMIQQELDRTAQLYPSFDNEDAMRRWAQFNDMPKKFCSLQNAVSSVTGDAGYQQAHRAMSDCRDTLEIIRHMANELNNMTDQKE